MKAPLKVSLVQLDIYWEQPARNLLKLDEILTPLKGKTDLILLPEMFTTGFTMNANAMSEEMAGPSIGWMKEQSIRLEADIAGSLIIKEEGKFYNRIVWVGQEGVKYIYNKRHLFSMAGEEKIYTPGNDNVSAQLQSWQIRPQICYDLRFPVWSRNDMDFDLLIYLANWPDKRKYHWRQLLIARAIENQAYVIGLNRVGWDGEQYFYAGESAVVDPNGELLLDLKDPEIIKTITLDHLKLETTRYNLPFLKDRDQFKIID
jgi:predicted amidohydrolase